MYYLFGLGISTLASIFYQHLLSLSSAAGKTPEVNWADKADNIKMDNEIVKREDEKKF